MNIWRDKTFGVSGAGIWFPGLSPVILTVMFLLFASQLSRAVDFIGFGVPLLIPAVWGCFYIAQVKTVMQEIVLDGNRILGKLYFGQRVEFNASEIKSFSYYPMSWKIRQINLFDRNKQGINIELLNGDIVRINAKTEGLESLVASLKAFAQSSGQIRCTL